MEIPQFTKDELPEELQELIDGDDVNITPIAPELTDEMIEKQKQKSEEKNEKLDRRLLKKLDELKTLKSLYDSNASRKENWKKIKKASRYFRSSLYEVKTLDKRLDP
jgi:hypothetical protein